MARLPDPSAPDGSQTVSRGTLWAWLASAACTLLLAYPALSGQFLINPYSDQFKAGYAFRHFAGESLKQGQGIPLWNPYLFGGMPYVAAMHGDVFYPTALLRMLLPTDVAMTWGFIIHMVLAGGFSYLFVRALGLSFASALVGGIAYLLSGTIASYASPGHDGKLFVSALLPLALYAVHRGVFDGRRWAWGLLAIVVGLQVLSPHPQLLQYSLLVTGAYALFAAWRVSRLHAVGAAAGAGGVATGNPWLRLVASLGAVALGMAMGAIQYWPVREYVDWSPRSGGKAWDHAISYSLPTEELVNIWLPQFSGILDQYWGQNGIHLHSEYLGASVLLLAAFGMASGRAVPALKGVRWFFVGTLIIATLWALGGNTPFYSLVYAIVPGTKFFRAPSTMLYVIGFATSVLAAFGVERIVRGELSRRAIFGGAGFALLMMVLAVTGSFTNLATAVLKIPQFAPRIDENAPAVVLGGVRSAVFALALCAAAAVAVAKRWRVGLVAGVLGVIVAADLWSIARFYWRFDKPASVLYAGDAVIDFLKTKPTARVMNLQLAENAAANDPYLGDQDGLMTHGVRLSLIGYHGNELGRYQTLGQRDERWASAGNPNFWALTNTRYLYTNTPTSPIEGAKLVAGPARNAAGTMVYLYEMPGDMTDAWVTPLSVKAPDEQALATVLDPRFNVRQAAIFAPEAPVATAAAPATPPAPLALTATTTRPAPGAIDIALSAPAPDGAALIVSENFYPGWTATVDGKSATVSRADYVLMGVPLPTGATKVSLRFTSPPYATGKVVTQAAVLGALLLMLWGLLGARAGSRPAPHTGAAAQPIEAAAA